MWQRSFREEAKHMLSEAFGVAKEKVKIGLLRKNGTFWDFKKVVSEILL